MDYASMLKALGPDVMNSLQGQNPFGGQSPKAGLQDEFNPATAAMMMGGAQGPTQGGMFSDEQMQGLQPGGPQDFGGVQDMFAGLFGGK